jgi:bifunctional non-homologous end joining protein LigD
MSRVVKRSESQALKASPSRRGVPLPQFVFRSFPSRSRKPPSGPQWVHEIKLYGFRMAARIDQGRVQLLTRTGLDRTAKYPSTCAEFDAKFEKPGPGVEVSARDRDHDSN